MRRVLQMALILTGVAFVAPDIWAACGGPNDCKPPSVGCPTGSYWVGCPTCECKPRGKRCPYRFVAPSYECSVYEVAPDWQDCSLTYNKGRNDSCYSVDDTTATCSGGSRTYNLKDWKCEKKQGSTYITAECKQLEEIKIKVTLNYCN